MAYHEPIGTGGAHLDKVLLFLSLPTVTMMIGSLLVFRVSISAKMIAALQHFASGILIGAAGWELIPEIQKADIMETVAIIIGFVLGAIFLLFVGRYDFKHWQKWTRLINERWRILAKTPEYTPVLQVNSEVAMDERPQYHSIMMKSDDIQYSKDTPYGLIFAVLVDGSIDGLLIGISCLSGEGAGLVTSIALALEMGLLGISTSTTLRKCSLSTLSILGIALTLPLSIFFSGLMGLYLLAGLSGPYYVATVAFGAVGLLYLVTEELMIEAHEDEETDTWYVSGMFFLGFLFVILLNKVIPILLER